jgi:sugar phosphate isomerase/epimerase
MESSSRPSSGAAPRFAVSAATTYHTSFEEDVANCRAAGIEGIGLWEHKLNDERDDERAALLADAGLTATYCFPNAPGIFRGNVLFAEPADPGERLELLCASIRRFAAYRPEAVVCLAGAPGPDGPDESRRAVVAAFRRAARVAEEAGVRLAVEVISPGAAGSLVPSVAAAVDLVEEVGADIRILLDTWHLADTPMSDVKRHIDRIAGIQVCDRTSHSSGRFDRTFPGPGLLPVEEVIRAAADAGFDGWYELEILSDDGTFGQPVEDSLWRRPPLEVLREGKASFDRVYAEALSAP